MSIRDTSAQDIPVGNAASRRSRQRRQWLLYGAGGLALLVVAAWLVSGWAAGSRSVDGDRVRIATVTRGDLVRDISAEG
ncbi:MAG TPA: efflux transporter periplasmic adaptor subunit, partial [Luteimonas sp.]|nr:efflux transporter periplasmic adaptor subunit [Luteimonas sp.]